MRKPRILTVSSAYMDFVMKLIRLPAEGAVIADEGFEYMPGGRGANAAVAVARLGGDSILCCCLGADGNGAKLRNFFNETGIDTRFIEMERNSKTGMLVFIQEEGRERIIEYPEANKKLKPYAVEDAFTAYPDALLLHLDIPAACSVAAARYANEQDIPIFVDAGPVNPDLDITQLGKIEIFSPNEDETYAYTGIYPSDVGKCLKACMALEQKISAKYIVLKLGERGCFLYDGKFYNFITAFEVDSVIDRKGAGDAFTAALTIEYMRSKNIKQACDYANAVGALTVTKEGTSPAIPTMTEVEKFMNRPVGN